MSHRSVQLVVFGQCYSMKNTKINGRFKHPKAQRFAKDFAMQVRPEHRLLFGLVDGEPVFVWATVRVYYPSHRQDLDTDLIYDCLQHTHVLLNDKVIREKHEYAEVDAKDPRCVILLEEIP